MESRRVVLLTEGYLHGWLKFDSQTPLSHLREEYILSHLEKQLLCDVATTKLGILGSLTGGSLTKKNLTSLSGSLKSFIELALPYMAEKSKIDSQGQSVNDAAFWRKAFAQKRQEEATSVTKEPPKLIPMLPSTYE